MSLSLSPMKKSPTANPIRGRVGDNLQQIQFMKLLITMFDRELSKQLIQQIELFRKYHDKVDDDTLREIMETRGLCLDKLNIDSNEIKKSPTTNPIRDE
jgi:hypothetical protein